MYEAHEQDCHNKRILSSDITSNKMIPVTNTDQIVPMLDKGIELLLQRSIDGNEVSETGSDTNACESLHTIDKRIVKVLLMKVQSCMPLAKLLIFKLVQHVKFVKIIRNTSQNAII